MRILFIFLLGLITFQVNAQKIIGSTTTAGGDLQGTYPNPTVKSNIINRANLTPTLRDSLLRFRKDTLIKKSTDGTLNLGSSANTLGKYNRVYIVVLGETGFTQAVVMPSGTDTLENTEFNITYISEDTTSTCQIAAFDGFAVYYNPPNINQDIVLRTLTSGSTVMLKPVYINGFWSWISAVSKNIYNEFFEEAAGITALTGDVTASGTGSVTATIATSAVTSSKILDGTIVSADIASQTVDSVDVKNRSITTVKLEDGAVTSLKVLDNSLTGSDLTYLTLRAGTTSNASLQLTSGSDKTTLTGGEIMYNGRFAVGIGSSKRRVATTNDAAASNGQIPIGNGSDFTIANITAGYAQTVTNGSGSITVNPDTTKVIPYIPSAEISDGIRDGYFRTQTSFGHQFYNGGFRIFNSSLATTSGSTQLYVSNGTNDVGHLLIVSSAGATSSQTYVNNGSNGKSTTLDYKGFTTQVYYTSISLNNQAVSNYQIDGQNGLERITDGTVTTITLPEIVGNPSTNQVSQGFTFYLTINSPTTVTITRAGSDSIEVHGAAAATNTVTATTGTIYSKKFVATGANTWTVF